MTASSVNPCVDIISPVASCCHCNVSPPPTSHKRLHLHLALPPQYPHDIMTHQITSDSISDSTTSIPLPAPRFLIVLHPLLLIFHLPTLAHLSFSLPLPPSRLFSPRPRSPLLHLKLWMLEAHVCLARALNYTDFN